MAEGEQGGVAVSYRVGSSGRCLSGRSCGRHPFPVRRALAPADADGALCDAGRRCSVGRHRHPGVNRPQSSPLAAAQPSLTPGPRIVSCAFEEVPATAAVRSCGEYLRQGSHHSGCNQASQKHPDGTTHNQRRVCFRSCCGTTVPAPTAHSRTSPRASSLRGRKEDESKPQTQPDPPPHIHNSPPADCPVGEKSLIRTLATIRSRPGIQFGPGRPATPDPAGLPA